MLDQYFYECGCGNTHTTTSPNRPQGWQFARDGKPVCDDCVSATRARRTRRAA